MSLEFENLETLVKWVCVKSGGFARTGNECTINIFFSFSFFLLFSSLLRKGRKINESERERGLSTGFGVGVKLALGNYYC